MISPIWSTLVRAPSKMHCPWDGYCVSIATRNFPTITTWQYSFISISPLGPNWHWYLWSWDPLWFHTPKLSFFTLSASTRWSRSTTNVQLDSMFSGRYVHTLDWSILGSRSIDVNYSLYGVFFRWYFIDWLTITHVPTMNKNSQQPCRHAVYT